MTPPAPTELQEQQALRKRLYYAAPEVHVVAIPNAARRTQWEVRRAKAEGMATGFPDLAVFWPGGVAFIEMKSHKGRVTVHQAEWIDRLTRYGFPARVCYSADAAMDFLRECGAPVRERAA